MYELYEITCWFIHAWQRPYDHILSIFLLDSIYTVFQYVTLFTCFIRDFEFIDAYYKSGDMWLS